MKTGYFKCRNNFTALTKKKKNPLKLFNVKCTKTVILI